MSERFEIVIVQRPKGYLAFRPDTGAVLLDEYYPSLKVAAANVRAAFIIDERAWSCGDPLADRFVTDGRRDRYAGY